MDRPEPLRIWMRLGKTEPWHVLLVPGDCPGCDVARCLVEAVLVRQSDDLAGEDVIPGALLIRPQDRVPEHGQICSRCLRSHRETRVPGWRRDLKGNR